MIERPLGAHQPKSFAEDAHVRRARSAGFDDAQFHVSDEALISWAARGTSVEDVHRLARTAPQDHA